MQKLGDVVMYKEINNFKLIVGKTNLDSKPLVSFNSLACNFLNELSRELIKDKTAKKFSDIISFAFWCRNSNIKILKEKFYDNNLRVGLGLVFHITPSNVPVNFAFSLNDIPLIEDLLIFFFLETNSLNRFVYCDVLVLIFLLYL